MKNFMKTVSKVAEKCFWTFIGAGALAVGVFYDYLLLDAFMSPGALDMNALEWFVVTWMCTIPTIIGGSWVAGIIDKGIKRIRSTEGKRVAA